MKTDIERRACELAAYIIETRATVRAAAKKFNISKSTVHKDLSERLEHVSRALYLQVKDILEFNKAERHIRGGIATRLKYKRQEARGSGSRSVASSGFNEDRDAD
ncbi:MAG: sporulation transcriptional regulator SpoIIID [Oscillospiraceae bacterium]|nr:sporulation transcriptional regulator SpoIIID [Oscillospiraceae bacterium]